MQEGTLCVVKVLISLTSNTFGTRSTQCLVAPDLRGSGGSCSVGRRVGAKDKSAPLSRCTLLRHSSFVRAVCVNALLRICAGAFSNERPYRDSNRITSGSPIRDLQRAA